MPHTHPVQFAPPLRLPVHHAEFQPLPVRQPQSFQVLTFGEEKRDYQRTSHLYGLMDAPAYPFLRP